MNEYCHGRKSYSWYDQYYGSKAYHGRFKGVNYNYYNAYSQTFKPGTNGYNYYYWYHYADSTDHWAEKLKLGWTNWADVLQGAYIQQASSFIQTWKCHETTALSNVLEFSQFRKDVCENGDRRWIFRKEDPQQRIIIDLGQQRWIAELGVDFGDAAKRLPKGITFSYLPASEDTVNAALFTEFGTTSKKGIEDYTKIIKSGGVTTRYIMYDFEADSDATAFMQLVAAGPDMDESSGAGYVALIVIVIVSLLAVVGFVYIFLKGKTSKSRRFYKASSYSDVGDDNEEFSTDSDSDSDDSGGSSSGSTGSSDDDSDSEMSEV